MLEEKAIKLMGKAIEITFSGYKFDVWVKDRKTGEVLEAYQDIDPDFVMIFINELLSE